MLFLPLLLHDFLKFSNLIFHIALLFLIPGSKLIGLLPLPCVIFFCPSWTANVMMRVSLGLTRHCDQILVDLFYLELLHHRRVRHQHPHPRSRQLLPLPRLLIQLALAPTHRILLHMAHSHFLLQKNFLGNIAAIRTFLRSKPSTKCTSRSSLTKIKEENCGLRKLTSEATLEPGNLSNIETF